MALIGAIISPFTDPLLIMIIKILMFLDLLVIIISLFSGMFFLVKDEGKTKKTVNALTVRVIASVVMVILIAIGIYTGQLQPHGLGV